MKSEIVTALRATGVTLVVTGVVYPLLVTAAAQCAMPTRANGSMVLAAPASGGPPESVGSHLLGQAFTDAAYVQPRPSAAGAGYDPAASGGSNLGPTSSALRERVRADVARLRSANPAAPGPVPAELVTTSASGLDPHLSPAAAAWQVPRIAAARGVAPDRVAAVLAECEEGRDLGVLGEPRIEVLRVNLALDRRFGRPRAEANMRGK